MIKYTFVVLHADDNGQGAACWPELCCFSAACALLVACAYFCCHGEPVKVSLSQP